MDLVRGQPNNPTRPINIVDSLEELDALAVMGMGLLQTVLMLGTMIVTYKIPGHEKGGLWPIWIAEHYSDRTSQHPLDPYSFAHVSHGTLGYVFTYTFGMDPGLGFLITTFSAVLWEIVENSEFVINLFRENSGPSEDYKGDSQVNVVGDILSASLGYGASYLLSRQLGGSLLPALGYFILSELFMTLRYRDSMLLLGYQVVANDPAVAAWQSAIIPQQPRTPTRGGLYWQRNRESSLYRDALLFYSRRLETING